MFVFSTDLQRIPVIFDDFFCKKAYFLILFFD